MLGVEEGLQDGSLLIELLAKLPEGLVPAFLGSHAGDDLMVLGFGPIGHLHEVLLEGCEVQVQVVQGHLELPLLLLGPVLHHDLLVSGLWVGSWGHSWCCWCCHNWCSSCHFTVAVADRSFDIVKIPFELVHVVPGDGDIVQVLNLGSELGHADVGVSGCRDLLLGHLQKGWAHGGGGFD